MKKYLLLLLFIPFLFGARIEQKTSSGGGSESTTVSDTTTINLTLTGSDITADGLYTAGDALTLTGADIDFDGGASPGGSLGGTWASPTIDDLFVLNSAADTMLGNLTIR